MSFKIYPTAQVSDFCDYEVKINGQSVQLNEARVSAVPFNRRWPGHQRDISQSERIHFIGAASDEALFFEITPKTPFDKVEIRPRSLGVSPEISNGVIRFTLPDGGYFTVEPYGRNRALHVFIDKMPHYDVRFDDENVLYFGAGEHDVGQIELKSNQTLFIDEGAVVYACVKSTDAQNIKILGRGILDNSRNREQVLYNVNLENNDAAADNAIRQHTVQLEYCDNVEIDGITIRDSLVYNIRPICCKNLHIADVKIIGCWRYNSDGIDMHNCEDVLIENCFIRTFDDSICVKGFDFWDAENPDEAVRKATYHGGRVYDTFKRVHVRNCTIWNDWGKTLEIGAETRAREICDVLFENCNVIHVMGDVLDCCNVDNADVHAVCFQNINVEFDETIPQLAIQRNDKETYKNTNLDYAPAVLSARVLYIDEYSAGGKQRGINRDITYRNIRLYGRQKPCFVFEGYSDKYKTKDIKIIDFYYNDTLLTSFSQAKLYTNEFTENIVMENTAKQ